MEERFPKESRFQPQRISTVDNKKGTGDNKKKIGEKRRAKEEQPENVIS
jgi:hypothetical protein